MKRLRAILWVLFAIVISIVITAFVKPHPIIAFVIGAFIMGLMIPLYPWGGNNGLFENIIYNKDYYR